MIITCEKCDTTFNIETTQHCPSCYISKKKRKSKNKIKSNRLHNEIKEFKRENMQNMKRMVGSERSSDVSKYEKQTGRQVY